MNKEIKGEDALRKLIEIKDKKIWDMNLEIGKMTSELVNLRGAQQIVRKLDAEKQDYMATIKSLETALANALAEDHRQKEADELMMKKLERIQELEAINESHKELNGNLRREITVLEQEKLELHIDNKKLANQIQDQLDRARKAGL
jgi:DNA anti-recombination protein RmuC